MPRTERNPNLGKGILHEEADVTLIMVTHYPEDTNSYYSTRYPVITQSLRQMIDTTAHLDRDILIWDNGSGPLLRKWLTAQPDIDYLILSGANLGITTAIYYALKLAPGRIVGISDDDTEFRPGWFEMELEILETYPQVATVCGYPVWEGFWNTNSAFAWAADADVDVEFLKYDDWPREWEEYHMQAIGGHAWSYAELMKRTPGLKFTYKGVEALACGGHCQFIGYKNIIQPFARPLDVKLGARYKYFDQVIDDHGYMRLSTPVRCTRHIGNKL